MSREHLADATDFRVNFFGIGFAKCGTTWVSRHLDAHPEIGFSKIKETNHFATQTLIEAFPEDFETMRRVASQDTYHRQFSNQNLVTGEFSVYYAYDTETLRNIKSYNEQAKILVCLRNPVDAAISNHRYVKNSLRADDFADDILEEFDTGDYLLRKYCYSQHLANIYSVFDPQNVHIVVFDDIKNDPRTTLRELYDFLHVDASFVSADNDREVYATGQLQANKLTEIAKPVIGTLRRVGAHRIIDAAHNTLVRHLPAADKTTYTDDERRALKKLFADDIEATTALLADNDVVVQWVDSQI